MKYENKSFSVSVGDTKSYRDNYDKIDWSKRETPKVETAEKDKEVVVVVGSELVPITKTEKEKPKKKKANGKKNKKK